MALTIPLQLNSNEFDLYYILEEANLVRMKQYDPAQVDIAKLPPQWGRLKLRSIVVGFATDADVKKVQEFSSRGEIGELFKLLTRGWRFRPDLGDNDEPYQSIKDADPS